MTKKLLDKPTPTVNDLAKKYGVPVLQVKKQLLKGIKVEKEHTDHPKIAREIALDHLGERLDYYTKLDKAHLEEETGVSGVRGLGYVSGDPGVNPISQYVDTNAMSYEDENGNKLAYIKKAHADLHNQGLGYNFFDPTKIKSSSNYMNEATTTEGGLGGKHSPQGEGEKYLDNNVKNTDRDAEIREKHAVGIHHDLHADNDFNDFRHTNVKGHSNKELKEAREKVSSKLDELGLILGKLNELGGSGEPNGYTGISDPPPKLRANDQLEEGPLKDKAKKVAMAGITAANMYSMADVAGRATEGGHGSPKGDVVRAASALPGAIGWGATAVHYGKKGYDLAKDALKKKKGHMEEEKKMPNPCWKGYKAYGMKKKDGKEVPNCVPVEETAAWTRSAGKDPEGGLNRKGIASYRREHPGSKLSMAVTTEPSKLKPGSKAANRRKSFCARMGGMKGPMKDEKGRPTRKALALRKWNCEEQNKYPDTAERGIYEKAPPGDKYERMVKHIKAGYAKDGLTKKEKGIAFATAWKAKNKEKLDELKHETLGSYLGKASASRKKALAGPKADIKTWGKRQKGITTAIKKLTKENSKDKDWDEATGPMGKGDVAENMNKPDTRYAPGATGITRTIHEDNYERELEHPDFIHTVSREANLRDPKSVDAVLHVMHNRMGQKGYGSSPLGVVRQKGQFAAYGKGAAKGFTDEHKANILNRAKAIFSGQEKDITGGANEFRTTSAKNRPGGTVIGGNTFYKTGAFAKATPKQPTQVAAADTKPSVPTPQPKPQDTGVKPYTPKEIQPKAPAPTPTPAPAPTQVVKAPEPPKPTQVATAMPGDAASSFVKKQLAVSEQYYTTEETTMENQNLINEAIENILENDLVSMKENLMTALQEKAQEKLEERKKQIASDYFAQ